MRRKNTEKPVYMEQYARVAAVLNVGQGEVEGNIFRRPFVFEQQAGWFSVSALPDRKAAVRAAFAGFPISKDAGCCRSEQTVCARSI